MAGHSTRKAALPPRKSLNARGAEPFVEVPWDEALDLAARELDRICKTFGNQSIYGGSYDGGAEAVLGLS
jgi:biotin/methionine sulfoxide reductase